jgi:hypothetical protein
MAGEAKTTAFMLSSATVMIGPSTDMWDLNVAAHSIGLVKNFQIGSTPTYLDLMQGARGSIVYTTMTANPVKASCEVYEYTSRNLAYGLGLDGSALTAHATGYVTAAIITGTAAPGVITTTFLAATDVSGSFPVGSWISFQIAHTDSVHIAKISATTTVSGTAPSITHTLTFANHGVKTGMSFPTGTKINKVNRLEVGATDLNINYAAKVIGILPDGNKPVSLLIPKVRIIRGFNMSFTTDNYGNMPFEFQPMDLTVGDPFYAEFHEKGPVALFMST